MCHVFRKGGADAPFSLLKWGNYHPQGQRGGRRGKRECYRNPARKTAAISDKKMKCAVMDARTAGMIRALQASICSNLTAFVLFRWGVICGIKGHDTK